MGGMFLKTYIPRHISLKSGRTDLCASQMFLGDQTNRSQDNRHIDCSDMYPCADRSYRFVVALCLAKEQEDEADQSRGV